MQEDFLYLEDSVIKVTDMAMQMPEFRDFKRYDTSTNKVFFYKAMAYIYYVYKVFGEERSYLHNQPLPQRRMQAVKSHTGSYKNISDFEENEWVQKCIHGYLKYSRTRNEILLDTLKEDIDMFSEVVQKMPHMIKKKIKVTHKELDEDGQTMIDRVHEVEIDIPNTKERLDALKQASDLYDYYVKVLANVNKDAIKKRSSATMFENQKEVSKITITDEFPRAKE